MKGLSMESRKRKRIWLISAFAVLFMGSVAVYAVSRSGNKASAVNEGAQIQTTGVLKGSIVLSTSGTGKLVAGDQVDLSFSTSGTVAQVNVEVGDQVKAGDVLAVLDDLDSLQIEIETKQLEADAAQKAVEDLSTNSEVNLAEAKLALAQVKEAYVEAQKNVVQAGAGRCPAETTAQYYYDYLYAQKDVNEWESYLSSGTSGYGKDYILQTLAPLRKTRDKAYTNWQYCQNYTVLEAETSQAAKNLTEADLSQAQTKYDDLLAVSGVDPDELALAEAELENAASQLKIAKNALAGASIIAPMDGTVMAVAGDVGETATTETFITLADMEHPNLEIYIDEVDMNLLQVGNRVSVVFDAVPDWEFEGTVTQIEPMLVEVDNYDVVQGLVDLNDTQTSAGRSLLLGMTASIEVIAGEAENVLLVSADALFDIAGSQATVWLENDDGSFTSKRIEIGLMDYSQAEVVEGLDLGNRVSLEPVD